MWYMTSTVSTGRGLHSREVTFKFWGGGGAVGRSALLASAGVDAGAAVLQPFPARSGSNCRASTITLHRQGKSAQYTAIRPKVRPTSCCTRFAKNNREDGKTTRRHAWSG